MHPNNRQLLKKIVGEGEIARNEQFLLFPQCFQLSQKIISPFVYIFDITSSFAAELEDPQNSHIWQGLSTTLTVSLVENQTK